MLRKAYKISLLIIAASLTLFSSNLYSETESSWDNLLSGMERYGSSEKLKTKFIKLCQENKTAVINGRLDTGDGLYMRTDVPVFKQPGQNMVTELKDKAVVIVTGASQKIGSKEWVQIKFLRVAAETELAINIEDGWIQKIFLK
jgi:hypothetical protein